MFSVDIDDLTTSVGLCLLLYIKFSDDTLFRINMQLLFSPLQFSLASRLLVTKTLPNAAQ